MRAKAATGNHKSGVEHPPMRNGFHPQNMGFTYHRGKRREERS
jgi:hypothetical protein